MGRTYDVKTHPQARAYGTTGLRLIGVFRVEFDADADEGPATVHAYVMDGNNQPIQNESGGPATCSYRAHIRIRMRPDAPQRIEAVSAKPLGLDEPLHP